jgi:hypothetical protein
VGAGWGQQNYRRGENNKWSAKYRGSMERVGRATVERVSKGNRWARNTSQMGVLVGSRQWRPRI